jgi:uncharacterized phage protein (TIGR02218 family)
MTYDATERSVQAGAPVELYEFTRGEQIFRYTSADADFSLLGNTYATEPLRRSQIETSAERARNGLTIECRREFAIAELFRVAPPTDVIGVVIKRVHRDDLDPAVIWNGRVLNCGFDGVQARLNCEPASTSLKRPGLRRLYQRQCPHVLYAQGPGQCNVVRATHSTVTTVSAVSGVTLSVAALASKPWAGGFVEWEPASGVLERRFILSFSGLALTLSQAFQGIEVGDTVTVSPGCDHTTATCSSTYGNLANYGGMPFMPDKNPFDGTPVF